MVQNNDTRLMMSFSLTKPVVVHKNSEVRDCRSNWGEKVLLESSMKTCSSSNPTRLYLVAVYVCTSKVVCVQCVHASKVVCVVCAPKVVCVQCVLPR